MAARDLYTSPWFRKASAYAAQVADEWYILSARYGLVDPDRVIAPYDETLKRMRATARQDWARKVVKDLQTILQPGDHVLILAGLDYRENLVEPLRQMGCRVEVPMEGLGIGEQLRWLNEALEANDVGSCV